MASKPEYGDPNYRWTGAWLFECVGYCKGRASKKGYTAGSGNACDGPASTSRTPQVGDCVVGTGGTGYGHVAFIESISGNTATISHGWYVGSIKGENDRSGDYKNFSFQENSYTLGSNMRGLNGTTLYFKGYFNGGGSGGSGDDDDDDDDDDYKPQRHEETSDGQWDTHVPSGTSRLDDRTQQRTVYRVFDYTTNTGGPLLTTKPN